MHLVLSDEHTRERYNRQIKRETAQHRMRGKIMEEEWLWEGERIAAMWTTVSMSTGTDMRMGDVETLMPH